MFHNIQRQIDAHEAAQAAEAQAPSGPFGSEVRLAKEAAQAAQGQTVEQVYQSVLGRGSDPDGLAFWQKAFGDNVDPSELARFKEAAVPELAVTKYSPPPPPAPDGPVALDISGNPYASVADLYRDILGRDPENQKVQDDWMASFGKNIDANDVNNFRTAAGLELTTRAKTSPLDAIALYSTNLNENTLNLTPQNIAQYKDLKFAQPEYEAKYIDPATGQVTTDLSKGILAMVEKPRFVDYSASGFTPEKTGQVGKEVTTYRKPVSTLLDAIYDARGNLQGYVASRRAELGNGNYLNAYYDPKGKVKTVYGKSTLPPAKKKAEGGSIGGLNAVGSVDVSKLKPIIKMGGLNKIKK